MSGTIIIHMENNIFKRLLPRREKEDAQDVYFEETPKGTNGNGEGDEEIYSQTLENIKSERQKREESVQIVENLKNELDDLREEELRLKSLSIDNAEQPEIKKSIENIEEKILKQEQLIKRSEDTILNELKTIKELGIAGEYIDSLEKSAVNADTGIYDGGEEEYIKDLIAKTKQKEEELEILGKEIEEQENDEVKAEKKARHFLNRSKTKIKDNENLSEGSYEEYRKEKDQMDETRADEEAGKLLSAIFDHVEKKISPEKIEGLENILEEKRNKYIDEYKKCKSESDKQNLIIKTKNSILNVFTKNKENKKNVKIEDFYTDKLKEDKEEYNKARIELGNAMYESKKVELEKAGLSGEELEKALVNYKATEILAKTIIEERQKIIDAKVKDPSRWEKLLNGYRKMPKWQRIALSTALFTAAAGLGVTTGGIFAGYGLATMAAMKFGTSMATGALTTYSVKGIDLLKKKSDIKFTEHQSNIRTILKERFATHEIIQEEYEKQIELLEKEEAKRARNRMLLKAGVGIAIAGTAGHFAYDALGNGLSHIGHINNLHNTNVVDITKDNIMGNQTKISFDTNNFKSGFKIEDQKIFHSPVDNISKLDTNHFQNISEELDTNNVQVPNTIFHKIEPKIENPSTIILNTNHSSIEAVADHGQGAISTLRELQHNLRAEYGNNLENTPESVKHILNTDPHKLAQEYGMYKPGQDAESAFIKSGSSFKVDNQGNLTYHEAGGHDVILEKGIDIKPSSTYEGKMFDSNHSGLQSENIVDNKYELPPQVNPETGKYHIENVDKGLYHGQKTMLIDSQGDERITTPPLAGLSTEDLHQVYTTFHENINHLFPTEKLMSAWHQILKTTPADRLMELYDRGEIKPEFNPLIDHIKQLEDLTGFKPISESPINEAESITHFMNRAMEKIQLEGKLDEVKL